MDSNVALLYFSMIAAIPLEYNNPEVIRYRK